MAVSSLQQVLDYFEDLSPGLVGSMVDFWVRKGRIQRLDLGGGQCGGCSSKGSCPLIAELPECYQVVKRNGTD
jgi:hypothetical protein